MVRTGAPAPLSPADGPPAAWSRRPRRSRLGRVLRLGTGLALGATVTPRLLARVTPRLDSTRTALGPRVDAALDRVVPTFEATVDRMGPALDTVFERLAPALDATKDRLTPAFDAAQERMVPAVDLARERMSPMATTVVTAARDRVQPVVTGVDATLDRAGDRLSQALTTSAPARAEALRRGTGALAALRGSAPVTASSRSWPRTLGALGLGAAVGAAAGLVARRLTSREEPAPESYSAPLAEVPTPAPSAAATIDLTDSPGAAPATVVMDSGVPGAPVR